MLYPSYIVSVTKLLLNLEYKINFVSNHKIFIYILFIYIYSIKHYKFLFQIVIVLKKNLNNIYYIIQSFFPLFNSYRCP